METLDTWIRNAFVWAIKQFMQQNFKIQVKFFLNICLVPSYHQDGWSNPHRRWVCRRDCCSAASLDPGISVWNNRISNNYNLPLVQEIKKDIIYRKMNIPANPTNEKHSLFNLSLSKYFGMHCNENPIYIFFFWELRVRSPNFHIHVSVSDLYISRISPHIFLQQNIDRGNI